MKMYIPALVVVISNTLYHICAKSIPDKLNSFASLSVTYAVGFIASVIMLFISTKNGNILAEYRSLNWASFALGLAIVGLEAGFLWMYKVGWNISTAQIFTSAFLAVTLLFVGYLLYKEAITAQKVAGVVICLVGLYLLNK